MQWGKRRFSHLHSQSVQNIIEEYLEAVKSTIQLRKQGRTQARYPHRLLHFRDVPYSNQAARLENRQLILPNIKAGNLVIRLPDGIQLTGRLIEVRLTFGKILLICEVPDPEKLPGASVGVDLGVNTLIAVTDGTQALLISGREAKATIQWRNKKLSSLIRRRSKHRPGSRRHKRLQRRKYKLLDKARNRLKDVTHRTTHIVKTQFPRAFVHVGKPFNTAAQQLGRVTAQQVSSACNRKVISQLGYKLAGVNEIDESYSSQTCPVCGERNRCRRTYQCTACGYTAPRDIVGAGNILCIGLYGEMVARAVTINNWIHLHPIKYPTTKVVGSSGGHPASSSKT